jgi:hypothetical protein
MHSGKPNLLKTKGKTTDGKDGQENEDEFEG